MQKLRNNGKSVKIPVSIYASRRIYIRVIVSCVHLIAINKGIDHINVLEVHMVMMDIISGWKSVGYTVLDSFG